MGGGGRCVLCLPDSSFTFLDIKPLFRFNFVRNLCFVFDVAFYVRLWWPMLLIFFFNEKLNDILFLCARGMIEIRLGFLSVHLIRSH